MKLALLIKQRIKINTLENEIDTLEGEIDKLKGIIKDELYQTFMQKLQEPQEINRLKRENTNLRKKNKALKQLLKDDN